MADRRHGETGHLPLRRGIMGRSGHRNPLWQTQYNFKGYLQCDGFAEGETAFKTKPDVRLLNRLVHIRRHFEQALDENRGDGATCTGLRYSIYKIERQRVTRSRPAGMMSADRRVRNCPGQSWRQWGCMDVRQKELNTVQVLDRQGS